MKSTFSTLANQAESVSVNYSIGHVFEAAIKAAGSKGFKIKDTNKILNRLTVLSKASLFSWGEIITVQFEEVGEKTKVSVSSQPKTTIGSQGKGSQEFIGRKNKKNIDRYFDALSKCL